MTKLDSNFGAPFQVASYDGRALGVVNSYADKGEADEAAAALKTKLEAFGSDTDVYVVDGQPGLAQLLNELQGVSVSAQTDNSAAREQKQADELVQPDKPKAKK